MIRRLALLLALVAAGACSASAAAPIRVSLVRPLPTAVAARAWTATLAVRPASYRGPVRVTATGPRRLDTRASRARGGYRARFVFPAAGRWALTARAGGSTSRLGSIRVRPASPVPLDLTEPTTIELEPGGTLLVVENALGRLLRVDPASGSVAIVASRLDRPFSVVRAPSGAIFVSGSNVLWRLEGTTRAQVAEADADIGPLTLGASGDVFFTTATRVFRLAAGTGPPIRVAGTGVAGGGGDGGPALDAQVSAPHGLATAGNGALLVADTGNDRIRRIDPASGVITTLAQVGIPDGIDVAADGTIYVVEARTSRVVHLTASGERIGFVGPGFRIPYDVEVAPDGVVYVLEAGPSGRLKRVALDGSVTTLTRSPSRLRLEDG
jgi:hypothetical protein